MKKIIILHFLIGICILSFGFANNDKEINFRDDGKIEGTVTYETNPIQAVVISAENDNGDFYETTTNTEGHYLLEINDGTYDIVCQAWPNINYFKTETVENISVNAGEIVIQNFQLSRCVNPPQNLSAISGETDVMLDWDPPTELLGEIAYDDGSAEGYYYLSSPSTDQQYIYVKFSVPVATTITNIAVLNSSGSSNTYWKEILVVPDNTYGKPDIANPFVSFSDIPVESDGEWEILETNIQLANPCDFYVLTRWQEGSTTGPYIAGDMNLSANRSGYTTDGGATWTSTEINFIMRAYMTISGSTQKLVGIVDDNFIGSPKNLNKEETKKIENYLIPQKILTQKNQKSPNSISQSSLCYVSSLENSNRSVQYYEIYRGTESGVYGETPIGTTEIPHSSYQDYGLDEDTYYYAVKAIWDEGESDFSNEVCATAMAAYDVPWNTHFTSQGYFTESNEAGDWEWGEPSYLGGGPSAYSAPNVWGTKLNGEYQNDQNAWLITQPFDLSQGTLTVSFATWFNIEANYDYGYFAIDHNADGNYDYLDTFTGVSDNWKKRYYALDDSLCTDYVRFAFIFQSDYVYTYAGWYIDDFSINIGQPEIVITPNTINTTILSNETDSVMFTIGNDGTNDLSYSIDIGRYYGGETINSQLYEDFEDLDITGWSIYDYSVINGVGFYNGSHNQGDEYCFGFNSYSYASDYTQWLITPLVSVEIGDKFEFWYRDMYNYGESFEVYALDTNDPETAMLTQIGSSITTSDSNWRQFSEGLNNFVGEEIYIGIKYTSVYKYFLLIDEISGPSWSSTPCNWLSIEPNEGAIGAGYPADNIVATFDATGILNGTYFADVVIDSNDPNSPDTLVATMNVLTLEPNIECIPDSFSLSANINETISNSLMITNNGEANSILTYEISTSLSGRDISGSTFECNLDEFQPNTTFDMIFTITNNSTDLEWIEKAKLTFPNGITINEITDFVGGSGGDLEVEESTGDELTILWSGTDNQGWGVIHDGESATATVNVSIDSLFFSDISLEWILNGDVYGGTPHEISGTMLLTNSWLILSPTEGECSEGETDIITLSISSYGLQPGVHQADIIISNNDSDSNPMTLPVTFTVAAAPTISYSPTSFSQTLSSDTTDFRELVISNNGSEGTTLDYNISISSDDGWLSISETSGSCNFNESDRIFVGFDSADLENGNFYGEITIACNDPYNQINSIPVNLVVQNLGTIYGQVTDLTETPIAGATISLESFQTITDEMGYYSFQVLTGEYIISCVAENYDESTQTVVVVQNEEIQVDFQLYSQTGLSLPFVENWESGDFDTNEWTFQPSQGNWIINPNEGRPKPSAQFNWNPTQTNYSYSLTSPLLNGTSFDVINLKFYMRLKNYNSATQEKLNIEVYNSDGIDTIFVFINNFSINWMEYNFDISDYAAGQKFRIKFVAYGENSYNIDRWNIDNIIVTPVANPGIITGTVTDNESGEPIAEAIVKTDDFNTLTDSYGNYSLQVPAGNYNVCCFAASYESKCEDVEVEEGQQEEIDFELESISGLVADFEAELTEGRVPLTVEFENNSSGDYEFCVWDFNGDNWPDSYEEEPEWTYYQPGIYTVQLWVVKNWGNWDVEVKESYINVYLVEGGTDVDSTYVSGIWDLENSPYNISQNIEVSEDDTLVVEDNCYIILDGSFNIDIKGNINAKNVTFVQSENANRDDEEWHGVEFIGSAQSNSILDSCRIYDTSTGINVSDASPTISNCFISGELPSSARSEVYGLKISGASSPLIENNEICNFENGIFIDNRENDESAPIIRNNYVRKDTASSLRTEVYALTITGSGNAVVEDNEFYEYDNGFYIQNETDAISTPTLINNIISATAASERIANRGIFIEGYVAADLEGNEINGYPYGVYYQYSEGAWASDSIPEFSNNFVIDTTGTAGICGYYFEDLPELDIANDTIFGYGTGIDVLDSTEVTEIIPTFSKLIIRKNTISKSGDDVGIRTSGYVSANIDSCSISGYETGMEFGNDSGDLSTPTLTGNRVQHSSSKSRSGKGVYLDGYVSASLDKNEFDEFAYGIYYDFSGDTLFANETPTLTGNRVQHSSSKWASGTDGIYVENLNRADIYNNTFYGYENGLQTLNTTAEFFNNIIWDTNIPITQSSSSLNINYNNLENYSGSGTGNLSIAPAFVSVDTSNSECLHLLWNSPCIDAGNPSSEFNDLDGTIADMGAYYFEQSASLSIPSNINFSIVQDSVNISWDTVSGAIRYNIYSSDNPSGGFSLADSVRSLNWAAPITETKKFYYIKSANNITSKIINRKGIINVYQKRTHAKKK